MQELEGIGGSGCFGGFALPKWLWIEKLKDRSF